MSLKYLNILSSNRVFLFEKETKSNKKIYINIAIRFRQKTNCEIEFYFTYIKITWDHQNIAKR